MSSSRHDFGDLRCGVFLRSEGMIALRKPKDWSTSQPALRLAVIDGVATAVPSGDWTIARASEIEGLVNEREAQLRGRPDVGPSLVLDFSSIGEMDTVGSLLLNRLVTAGGGDLALSQADEKHRILMSAVNGADHPAEKPEKAPGGFGWLLVFGRMGLTMARETAQVLSILGASAMALLGWIGFVRRFRWAAYLTQLERTGLNAAPIVALMSFLIGGILAQQGTFYFRRFAADLYVVDLAGMLTLRELGVLLTAIMVAGRSGSAMTAELGSMKMREEIDALRVLGIDPIEVLILPRLLALITAVPILTLIADLSALIGAALDAAAYGGIPGGVFLARLHEAIDLQTFFVGFTKAPFMALIIGLIASLEGLNVKGSTESLGERTTQAVVKSIFFVIVVDGFFAVFFASIGI